MDIIYSPDHLFHQSPGELLYSDFVPAFEKPERAELILGAVQNANIGPVIPPREFGLEAITKIHTQGLVELMMTAHDQWLAIGRTGAVYPYTWGTRGMRADRVPKTLDGKLAYYSFDCGTPITTTSWRAIKASADCALTGAAIVVAGANAFALCRPPGHHAGSDHYGGYCFINNAALAAQKLLDDGATRVAILDVDYHHGNGTQQIFYQRADVLLVNIHAHPDEEYPYLLGFEDEHGAGPGEGFNVNHPLPWGTEWPAWEAALLAGIQRINAYKPDAVVVSLGVDTYEKDPISQFKLRHEHFTLMGRHIATLNKPTLFVQEGGYAVQEIGINVANVLTGFAGA
jgi:acetoin utilization deacetylase AcuC-like enzyme